ncbi:unnamed protein product [Clonostachys solani]|uniref:Uncharacterized protein n=1 Tax=Clonostachys solani TaxID=160281 RepID=A0A9N9VW43_9HYPO|nr:unnamed protein product [Clonostachys solani]
MPNLATIKAEISKLPDGPPLVAALPGATTGIGSYIATVLASTYAKHGSKLRVYIVGRNAVRAKSVIAGCQKLSPGSEWRFVSATDLALISEVDRCCDDIIKQETEAPFHGGPVRLDLLYMTYCYPILKERHTTPEGLDSFISTVYYSRIRFITKLLPLLTASPKPGHVISVYSGSFQDAVEPGKLPIGLPPDSEYGVAGVRRYTTFMKTFLFEELAEKHAGRLSLTHIYPGLVDGPGFLSDEMPKWFRVTWRVLKPVLRHIYMTSPEDCGAVMVYLATSHFPAKGQDAPEGVKPETSSQDQLGGGAYAVGQRADAPNKVAYSNVRQGDTVKLVWDHTMKTLEDIEKANASKAS